MRKATSALVVIHAGPFSEVHLASSGSRKSDGRANLLVVDGFLAADPQHHHRLEAMGIASAR
jgi:hypothetical protein